MNLANRAFNNLTDKQKEVWRCIMRDCKSEYTTGKLLGISRDAVHDRLNKARRRYQQFIKGHRNEAKV